MKRQQFIIAGLRPRIGENIEGSIIISSIHNMHDEEREEGEIGGEREEGGGGGGGESYFKGMQNRRLADSAETDCRVLRGKRRMCETWYTHLYNYV